MVTVTLTTSDLTPSVVRILANSVNIGMKKNTSATPIENGTKMAEVQTQSFDNLTYSIQGVKFTGEAGTLTYDHLLKLLYLSFNSTNAPRLTVLYGKNSGTTLSHMVVSSAVPPVMTPTAESIPVILQSANVNIDAKDSVGGYQPQGSLSFVETRTV